MRGSPEIALVVSLAMLLIVLVGSLTGVLLPFLLGRLGLDPVTASGPLITTIAGTVEVAIYFILADRLLELSGAS